MKNKLIKKMIRIIALILLMVSVIIGITHSKYITKVNGNGEFQIAKWNFKVNGQTEEMATIKLLDTYDESTLINGKIAPGTSGSFDLVIDATESEVGVKYSVDFKNETNKPTNLKFKYQDRVFNQIEEFEDLFTGVIDADDTNKTRTLTVKWEWAYETGDTSEAIITNDKIDTSDGLNALDYSFDVVVTGTQVIPQSAV